jgi:hypothetical protein
MLEFFKSTDLNKSPVEALADYVEFYQKFFSVEANLNFDERKNFLKCYNKAVEKRGGIRSQQNSGRKPQTPIVAGDVRITRNGDADFALNGERVTGSIGQYLDVQERSPIARTSFSFFVFFSPKISLFLAVVESPVTNTNSVMLPKRLRRNSKSAAMTIEKLS